MTWYKKDTRTELLFAHSEYDDGEFAKLIKNSLPNSEYLVGLISIKDAKGYEPEYGQKIICTDLESTIAFSKAKTFTHVFSQSPYDAIDASDLPLEEKKVRYSAVHRNLNKSKRVIALNEKCRSNIQQFHSRHIYITTLPSTSSSLISNLEQDGIAIIVNSNEIDNYGSILELLAKYKPTLYFNSEENSPAPKIFGMRMPHNGFVSARPLIQIYLGEDRSDCTPLRINDASAANSVVIQINASETERSKGRWMPTDCIGYFNIDRLDLNFAKLESFISHLLGNKIFFDSVLSAQRRYLPAYKSNIAAFLELLTK
ncbi:hypothetical protein [Massilia oculi]|uniref:hypothetical protein n=1 Tax=Massilia oculi TaxID=945844 RepID=UPI001AAE31EA|nr:hypothetical protein [Massilia oculi]